MHDNHFSRTGVAACLLWTITAGLLIAAWLIIEAVPPDWRLAGMCAASASVLASVATTVTVRAYTLRAFALIRATSGLEAKAGGKGLESVR